MQWWQWILFILGLLIILWSGRQMFVNRPRRHHDQEERRAKSKEFNTALRVLLPIGIAILFVSFGWGGILLLIAYVVLTLACFVFAFYSLSIATEDQTRVSMIQGSKRKERRQQRQHSHAPGAVILAGAFCLTGMFVMIFMPGDLPFQWGATLVMVLAITIVTVIGHFFKWRSWRFRWLVAPAIILAMLFWTGGWTLPAILQEADKATTNETEVAPPDDFYKETDEKVACSQDSPYYQFGLANMATNAPVKEKLAADADLLAWAAGESVLKREVDAASIVEGNCLNQAGVDLHEELIEEVDLTNKLEELVTKYEDAHN